MRTHVLWFLAGAIIPGYFLFKILDPRYPQR